MLHFQCQVRGEARTSTPPSLCQDLGAAFGICRQNKSKVDEGKDVDDNDAFNRKDQFGYHHVLKPTLTPL